MLATFAFDVCHDVYRAAREVIDSRIPTLNMESSGKYTWHPDRMPRLAEYVADFARAGERALGDAGQTLMPVRRDASQARSASSMRFVPGNRRAVRLEPFGIRMGMDRQECLSYSSVSELAGW